MKNKIIKFSLSILFMSFICSSCSDVLDKKDLNAINEKDVWSDEGLSEGFINEIYDRSLPGWPINASANSDDAVGPTPRMYGELTPGSVGIYSNTYRIIKDINLLLGKVESGGLETSFVNELKGQALFFRALNYFNLVRTYGGVPLVLKLNSKDDDLEVPRNSTSDCMAQILLDLEDAINMLPSVYSDASSNYGRITKGAAMAFKGRVLLHYASEQFDPSQSQTGRWQDAYDANKEALTELVAQGKGLNADYANLWFDESDSNPEAIMVRRYTTDKTTNRDVGVRPFVVGTNGESWDKPTLSLIEAFPMKDGKAIDDATSIYTYDSDAFWVDRDPRFATTIAFNGTIWPLNDPEPNKTSDLFWTFQGSQIEGQADSRISPSSFYCKKAVDVNLAGGAGLYQGTTDWIEIRFAEVLLNYAEAANEIGMIDEAYTELKEIRKRAGIDSDGGMYGLKSGMTKDEMREAILLERRLEFAFEGKRSDDLRRRRMYDDLFGAYRKGYVISTTAAFDALDPLSEEILDDRKALEAMVLAGTIDLSNPMTYKTFFETTEISLERDGNTVDDGTPINFLEEYYFFDLPQSALDKNPELEQTLGWPGGTFDPLQ
ncbi:RagB/SusD family nutrient uptake outer membrane protein [Aestuariibaculum suncheonense]|uniref:RagB/SusD family nutrient uptake outer membrane protein n=1 Tax=Aestuariibaculum suncheonense TaxID=1028745 RepID=A0A8J6QEC3_9FLAO|nr:RagB/SusD family nutrient uptake outer membrane protein [Aestuariibaculum suncheonense]MBD0834852.1 RagB/SusD family nutrient uptake outer membrane protein [Aestuariibaculum suncheonense]